MAVACPQRRLVKGRHGFGPQVLIYGDSVGLGVACGHELEGSVSGRPGCVQKPKRVYEVTCVHMSACIISQGGHTPRWGVLDPFCSVGIYRMLGCGQQILGEGSEGKNWLWESDRPGLLSM